MKSSKVLSFPIFIIGLLSFFANGQQCSASTKPTAIYSRTRLPRLDYQMSVIYDGDDSILIFSGMRPTNGSREIFRFNITSEEIESLAPIPFQGSYAPVVKHQDGSYFYFGNDYKSNRVLKYDLASNSGTIVAELPFNIISIQTFFTSSDPNKVYLVENTHINVHEFDTESFCISLFTNITMTIPVPMATLGNFAYAFSADGRVVQIHRDTREYTVLGQSNGEFARNIFVKGTTVSTNKYAYFLGGYSKGSPFPLDRILQYDPATNNFTFIRIDDMPNGYDFIYDSPPSMVFVEKLNRIYFFGGGRDSYPELDIIWHIDAGLME